MQPVRYLALYLALIFLGGSLVAPLLYWAVQGAAGWVLALADLADHPFRRFVSRSWLVVGVLGLWPFLRRMGIESWAAAGLRDRRRAGWEMGGGFLLGFASLVLAAGLVLALEGRKWNPDRSAADLVGHFFNAALSGVAVGVIEELFFRGTLMGGLRRALPWKAALILSSGVYALLHFFEKADWEGAVQWYSGLALLPRMLHGLVSFSQMVPGFFCLFLAGLILGLAYQRTGRLWVSIGLHGGWVFCLKTYAHLTEPVRGASTWWFGSGRLIDGWFGLAVLVALFGLVAWRFPDTVAGDAKDVDDEPSPVV